MASLLADKMKKDGAELVLTNVGSPQNARSAMTSPNAGPHMGFIRVALSDPGRRRLRQSEISDRMRALLAQSYPGTEFLQWPGGLVASVFSNGYLAPIVVELQGDDLSVLDTQSHLVADVASSVPGIRDIYPSLQMDYPEIRVRHRSHPGGYSAGHGACGGPGDAGSDLGQYQHPERLGGCKQRPVVLRGDLV